MLKRLFQRLFSRSSPPSGRAKPAGASRHPTQQDQLDELDRQAPLKENVAAKASETPEADGEPLGAAVICREPVLNRQQKIAGYQFMLHEAMRGNIRTRSRRVLHLCTEVLVQNLLRANIAPLLGKRYAFIDIPDSFLDNECLTRLPTENAFFIIRPLPGIDQPSADFLLTHVRALRERGYRVGIQDPIAVKAYSHLLSEIDLVCMQGPHVDIEQGMKLVRLILKLAPNAALLVRDLPGMEDFDFCFKIGATLFQGAFVTAREHWEARNLGPNFARITLLMNKLRQDAETRELVALLKQDAAITLRLLRYINSAANGLRENVSSIERALALLGRAPLQRWLALLLCAGDRKQARADAVLESALVRARTMELLAAMRPPAEREAMFLTGLLSLIDVILQQPMEHALQSLLIDEEIRDALLHDSGPYAAALNLARACEHMEVDRMVDYAAECGIDAEQASTWYMDALAWTLTLQKDDIG
ncbi:MAG: HDOD domain-containing protein [Azoarcus sp.]|jgi:EAL and modified HD-GYP domain-containing signal transduction protein|nr:HDOD domain-containing protein [Azoarcus sp.]